MMIATSRLLPILPNLFLEEEWDREVLIDTGCSQTQDGWLEEVAGPIHATDAGRLL